MEIKETRTLYAVYDLSISPISFDFSAFLIVAERERRARKLDTLFVIIVPKGIFDDHHDNKQYDRIHASWRIQNILVPLTGLLPSCSGLTIAETREQAGSILSDTTKQVFPENYAVSAPIQRHHTGWTIVASHLGANIQYFQATQQARAYARQWIDHHAKGKTCVALTLREANFLKSRNSDLGVWSSFSHQLSQQGYYPIIFRDIDRALDAPTDELKEFPEVPEAVFNLGLRIGFYEECDICAFVANGPAQVCFYNKNVRFIYNVTGDWLERKPTPFGRLGIEFGETPPFANHFQRWIWQEQDAKTLLSHLKRLDQDIEQSKLSGKFEEYVLPKADNALPLEIIAKRFSDWADRTYGISTQEIELAEACYAESQPRDLDDQENQKRLINLALGSRNLEKAAALLFALGDKYGFTLETLLQLGIVHEAMDNYHEAIGYYARAVEIDESAAQIRYRLGMAYKGAKKFHEAAIQLEYLVRNGVKNTELYNNLGQVHEEMGSFKLALDCYRLSEKLGLADAQTLKRKLFLEKFDNEN